MPATKTQHLLSDLSARFGLDLSGDGDCLISGVGTLSSAGPEDISFLANRSYAKQLPDTRAGGVILAEKDAASCPTNCLVAENPYLAWAHVAALFDPRPAARPGIHASAVISESARLGQDVSIGAHAVIGDRCVIGDGCAIGPGTVLDAECRLGPACRLLANVSLGYGVKLGARVIIHPGAVIGADGFGIAFAADHWEKVPQLGSVTIGDDCEIGANSCIDRGAIADTRLEEDVRIDNLCQIGHNCVIGAHTAIAGAAGLAGSTTLGKYCLLGGRAGSAGHLTVADRTTITASGKVTKDITEPGATWGAPLPAMPIKHWTRILRRLRKLDELAEHVQDHERQLGKLVKDGK